MLFPFHFFAWYPRRGAALSCLIGYATVVSLVDWLMWSGRNSVSLVCCKALTIAPLIWSFPLCHNEHEKKKNTQPKRSRARRRRRQRQQQRRRQRRWWRRGRSGEELPLRPDADVHAAGPGLVEAGGAQADEGAAGGKGRRRGQRRRALSPKPPAVDVDEVLCWQFAYSFHEKGGSGFPNRYKRDPEVVFGGGV